MKITTKMYAAILTSVLALSCSKSEAQELKQPEIVKNISISFLPIAMRMPLNLLVVGAQDAATVVSQQVSWVARNAPVKARSRLIAMDSTPASALRTGAIPKTSGQPAVFNSVSFSMRKLGALAKFAPSIDQIRKNAAFVCHDARCSNAARAISDSVSGNRSASLRDKLNIVNSVVNRTIRYQRDQQIYGVADRWAKPSETMALGKGDCEDFAILKMAALHAMGVPADNMALVVVFDQRRNVYHAVLAVAAADRYFILDNVRNAVLTDRQLRDYMPLYSIVDGLGFFHGIKANTSKQVAKLQPIEMVAPGEGPEDVNF